MEDDLWFWIVESRFETVEDQFGIKGQREWRDVDRRSKAKKVKTTGPFSEHGASPC